jgi:hypothetical protein
MMNELGDQEKVKEKRERRLETVQRRLAELRATRSARGTGDENLSTADEQGDRLLDGGRTGGQSGPAMENKWSGDTSEQEDAGQHKGDFGWDLRAEHCQDDLGRDEQGDWSDQGRMDANRISIDNLRAEQPKTQDRSPTPHTRARKLLADALSTRNRLQCPWDTFESSGAGDGGKRELSDFGRMPGPLHSGRMRRGEHEQKNRPTFERQPQQHHRHQQRQQQQQQTTSLSDSHDNTTDTSNGSSNSNRPQV